MTSYREMFQDLDTAVLEEIYKVTDELLTERKQNEDGSGYAYDTLRDTFLQRFHYSQVDSFKPWMAVSKVKKKAFTVAWAQALRDLEKIGLTNKSQATKVLTKLVLRSPLFTDGLTMDLVLESLKNTLNLFDAAFPGYRQAGCVSFINTAGD